MLKIGECKGAIFDMDDTLLDNGGGIDQTLSLHARSRLAAIYEAADNFGIPELRTVTPTENVAGFMTARTHSLPGAVWNIMYMKGIVASDEIDPANEVFATIVARKNELHEAILRKYGVEVTGATNFVRTLGAAGLQDKLAIASSAVHRDIDIFIEKYSLPAYFPNQRIVSYEMVTHPKPHPEAFDKGFLSLDLPDSYRRSVLAFEDDPRGIESAKEAGLYVCAITTKFHRNHPALLAAKPDVIGDSYQEFTDLMGL